MTDTKNANAISERASDLFDKISRDEIAGDVAMAELRALHLEARDLYQKGEIESAIGWADEYYSHGKRKPSGTPEEIKDLLLRRLSRARWIND